MTSREYSIVEGQSLYLVLQKKPSGSSIVTGMTEEREFGRLDILDTVKIENWYFIAKIGHRMRRKFQFPVTTRIASAPTHLVSSYVTADPFGEPNLTFL